MAYVQHSIASTRQVSQVASTEPELVVMWVDCQYGWIQETHSESYE